MTTKIPEAEAVHHVAWRDLPLSCPMPGTPSWGSHPRVYLPLQETDEVTCGYCGTRYVLDPVTPGEEEPEFASDAIARQYHRRMDLRRRAERRLGAGPCDDEDWTAPARFDGNDPGQPPWHRMSSSSPSTHSRPPTIMTTHTMTSDLPGTADAPAFGRTTMILLGIALLLMGIAAIVFPFLSSIGVTVGVGALLVAAGVAQGFGAFGHSRWTGTFAALAVAVLWMAAGAFVLMRPAAGLVLLTAVVASVFLVEGVLKCAMAMSLRPLSGWGWLLFDGLTTLLLGAMLWWLFPGSALWTLGTLVGIKLLFSGWALTLAPVAVRASAGTIRSS